MTESNKKRFDKIVEEYAEKLNRIVSDGGTVYTLHDFDHHCCNLYKIVSDVILYEKTAFGGDEDSINERELYILNLAILLHDLGMTKYVDLTRDNHSTVSADLIREAYKNSANPLSDGKSGLSKNEIEALALIVEAHSDVKDGSVPDEVNGLKNPKLTNSMPGRVKKIRAKFLANILRMADELDITSDRQGSMDVRNELEDAVKNRKIIEKQLENTKDEDTKKKLEAQLKRYKSAETSLKFWKNLTLFKLVERDDAGNVKLCIDDDVIANEIAIGVSDILLANEVLEVSGKIDKEFMQFKNDIETNLQLASMIAIKKIDVCTTNEQLKTYLEDGKKKINIKAVKKDVIQPEVISIEMETKISIFIEKRNLYEVGHYKLHDNLCARDWIAVNEIISTESLFKKCEKQLLLHLTSLKKLGDKYLILGIDFCGMLVASRLAFILHKPYGYLIPDYKRMKSSPKEFDLDYSIDEFENVIIVTDVIVTFNTIKKLAEDYKMKEKIKAIYAILFRNTDDNRFVQESKEMAEKTYVLNSKFNIEVQKNDKCRYRDCQDVCKARNKTYD